MNIGRREFMFGLSASVLLGSKIPATGSENSNIHIVDLANGFYQDRGKTPNPKEIDNRHLPNHPDLCTVDDVRFLENLQSKGVDTIIRYYSDENNAGITCKNLTVRERDLLQDFGFAICMVYQFEGRKRGRYRASTAKRDAKFILQRATEVLNQPEGSAVYIGVDEDADKNPEKDVLDYFRILNDEVQGRFDIGIYAPGSRCKAVRDNGLAKYFWVPEAPAWDGTTEFMNSGSWTMYQNKTEMQRSALAVADARDIKLDTDLMNPLAGNTIGAFNKDGSIKTYAKSKIEMVAAKRFWVTAGTANLRETPNGKPIGHMCVARMVHVLGYQGNWAKVDIDEDGIAEGYIHKKLLQPLSKKPSYFRSGCKPIQL
ncbi:glycoside hydrolase domain-containing protein [Roseibium alexandrii]|uniref:Rv2525c-like glycoside hydrolase-like domain-containing protein n=1 Tax=Roseibium alexandrii (strain DSM 17067 / NCIMB 14079 / DFL-11) TaxID=244592 RepID=A0A5E8H440_ROSAD|nr:glycoside hydrolase domain-containing protein [Roseibium alexandrii]EEE46653.1 protein of unknown function (DUF1906) [Roseibium alexandrii DFL-11]